MAVRPEDGGGGSLHSTLSRCRCRLLLLPSQMKFRGKNERNSDRIVSELRNLSKRRLNNSLDFFLFQADSELEGCQFSTLGRQSLSDQGAIDVFLELCKVGHEAKRLSGKMDEP